MWSTEADSRTKTNSSTEGVRDRLVTPEREDSEGADIFADDVERLRPVIPLASTCTQVEYESSDEPNDPIS